MNDMLLNRFKMTIIRGLCIAMLMVASVSFASNPARDVTLLEAMATDCINSINAGSSHPQYELSILMLGNMLTEGDPDAASYLLKRYIIEFPDGEFRWDAQYKWAQLLLQNQNTIDEGIRLGTEVFLPVSFAPDGSPAGYRASPRLRLQAKYLVATAYEQKSEYSSALAHYEMVTRSPEAPHFPDIRHEAQAGQERMQRLLTKEKTKEQEAMLAQIRRQFQLRVDKSRFQADEIVAYEIYIPRITDAEVATRGMEPRLKVMLDHSVLLEQSPQLERTVAIQGEEVRRTIPEERLTEELPLKLRAEIVVYGQIISQEQTVRYKPWPLLNVSFPSVPSGSVEVTPGADNKLPIKIANASGVDFKGEVKLSTPWGFEIYSAPHHEPNLLTIPIRVGAREEIALDFFFKSPEHYSRGIGFDRSSGDNLTISLNPGGQTAIVKMFSSGERRSAGGSLVVDVAVAPGLGKITDVEPGQVYPVVVTLSNPGRTYMFITDIPPMRFPGWLEYVPHSLKLTSVPRPWSSAGAVGQEAQQVIRIPELFRTWVRYGALGVGIDALQSDISTQDAIADYYYTRYLIPLVQQQRLGIPLPPGESVRFSAEFRVTGSTGQSGQLEFLAGFKDTGRMQFDDLGTGASSVSAIMEELFNNMGKYIARQERVHIGRPAVGRADIQVVRPFAPKHEWYAAPLNATAEAAHRIQNIFPKPVRNDASGSDAESNRW